MKTFTDYLLDAFKIMLFGWFMIWLVSCDDTIKTIRLIQKYEDSVGLAKLQVWYIDHKVDSLRSAFSEKYPMRAFPRTRAGEQEESVYKQIEGDAYHELLHDVSEVQVKHYEDQKWGYYEATGRYKRIIDSLKMTLK